MVKNITVISAKTQETEVELKPQKIRVAAY